MTNNSWWETNAEPMQPLTASSMRTAFKKFMDREVELEPRYCGPMSMKTYNLIKHRKILCPFCGRTFNKHFNRSEK